MRLAKEVRVPARHGRAFEVKQGQILRLTQKAGPQIVDFNAWNRGNPREMLWAGRTRIIEGAHLTTGAKLWSVEPWMRPMFTIIADTAGLNPAASGACNHDLWYPRCNRGYHMLMYNVGDRRNCHNNIKEAIAEFGLGEEYVHDTFNAFMRTGLNAVTQKYFTEPANAKPSDHMDLRSEMDCLVAISSCPGFTAENINDLILEIYDPA
jgi:uncharacterized protein YcgI (DUF1989 family)